MDNYQMPVKAIVYILSLEIERKFQKLRSTAVDNDFINALKSDIDTKLRECDTYEKLEYFVGNYYRMSLSDWIESL